jgi:hypothetical protein
MEYITKEYKIINCILKGTLHAHHHYHHRKLENKILTAHYAFWIDQKKYMLKKNNIKFFSIERIISGGCFFSCGTFLDGDIYGINIPCILFLSEVL